jgi:hypothetical protein
MIMSLTPLGTIKNRTTLIALALILALSSPAFAQSQEKTLPRADTPSVLPRPDFHFPESVGTMSIVVQLPLLLVGIETGSHRLPRPERKGRRHPAAVVEAPVRPHLKILGRVPLLRLRVHPFMENESHCCERQLRRCGNLAVSLFARNDMGQSPVPQSAG